MAAKEMRGMRELDQAGESSLPHWRAAAQFRLAGEGVRRPFPPPLIVCFYRFSALYQQVPSHQETDKRMDTFASCLSATNCLGNSRIGAVSLPSGHQPQGRRVDRPQPIQLSHRTNGATQSRSASATGMPHQELGEPGGDSGK